MVSIEFFGTQINLATDYLVWGGIALVLAIALFLLVLGLERRSY